MPQRSAIAIQRFRPKIELKIAKQVTHDEAEADQAGDRHHGFLSHRGTVKTGGVRQCDR